MTSRTFISPFYHPSDGGVKKNVKYLLTGVAHLIYISTMPDQRSKDKHVFGVSLDKKLLSQIDRYCKAEGITRTEFFRRMAEAKLNVKTNTEDR